MQKHSFVLDSFDADKKYAKVIFIDETEIKSWRKAWLLVAFEPNLKAFFFTLAGTRTRWMRIISSSGWLKSTERSHYTRIELYNMMRAGGPSWSLHLELEEPLSSLRMLQGLLFIILH